jgi:hypothetical protein
MLKTIGIASITLGKDVFNAFKNGGISQVLKELSVNIRTAFSAAGVSESISSMKNSISGLLKPTKELGGVFTEFAKDVPNSFQKIKSALGFIPQATKDMFNFAKTVTTTHVAPNLIVAAEAASILKGGLIGLGAVLMNSDSGFVKFSGTLLLVAGILLGGFAYAVKVALGFIGELISSIGGALIDSMNRMELKFQKAEVAATNFSFTIAGMNREFGNSAGTLQSWTKIVDDLAESTLLSAQDAQKMAAEIMAVGHGLGLTQNQMEDLIRLIPNYVKAGDDAFDVTVSFLQALGGSSQGVLKYAVHLSDASVEHSKLAKSVGLSMDRMTEGEKVQARFNALIEQASPIMGRAALQLNTVAGSQQYLSKAIDQVQQKMGAQNFIIAAMNMAFARLATQVTKLPDPLWSFMGVLQEVLGVTMKVVGVFISWAFPIAAITGLFVALNAVVASNATVQLFLTKTLTMASVALGGQAVAVTSAATMWAAFGAVLKGVVVTAFASVVSGLKAVAVAIWTMTTAILANPLFWKVAAIVGAIVAVWNALKRIEEQTKIFSDALSGILAPFRSLTSAISGGTSAFSSFGSILSYIAKGIVSIAVVAVGSLISGFYSLAASIAYTLNLLTFGKVEMFSQAVDYANDKIAKLSGAMGQATASLMRFEDVAQASPMEEFNKGNQDAIDKLKGLQKELISATEKELIWAQALGKETKVMLLSKQLADERMALAKDAEEKKGIAREIEQANARIAVFPKSIIDDAKKSIAQLNIAYQEGLNTAEGIRKAGVLKLKEALAPLREKLGELSILPKTADTAKAAAELKNLMSATQTAINDEQTKKLKELSDARIQGELEAKLEIAKMRQDELAQIKLNAEKQIAAISTGDKAKYMTMQQQKEITQLVLSAKDKQIAELKNKEISAFRDAQLSYAQAIGDQTLAADLEYSKQLDSYRDMLEEQKIEYEQFLKVKDALEQQREDKKREASLSTANKVVSAIGGGISGIVTAIGASFGPIGEFVAGIINIMNKTPEEMKKFINDLVDAAIGLLQNIVDNIPIILIEFVKRIPDMTRGILRAISTLFKDVLFSGEFWKEFGNNLINSMIESWLTIWKWMLGMDWDEVGTQISDAAGSALKSITGIGGELFSVENLTEGPVADAADAATKNLIDAGRKVKDWLGMAWEGMKKAGRWLDANVWQPVWEGFKRFGGFILDTFVRAAKQVWEVFKQIGRTLIDMFVGAAQAVAAPFLAAGKFIFEAGKSVVSFLKNIFTTIINSFKGVFEGAWKMLKGIFTIDMEGIKEGFNKIITSFSDAFKGFGESIKKYFMEGLDAVGNFFSNLGTILWDGIVRAFSGIGDLFSKLFKPEASQGKVEGWFGIDIPFISFAEGGFVPGMAKKKGNSYENDTVPALLSPGELVLPRSITGNKELMEKIMAIIGGQVESQYSGAVSDKVFSDLAKRFGFSMNAWGWSDLDPTNPSGAIGQYTAPVLAPVVNPVKEVTESMLPGWLLDLWNSLKKIVSHIDLAALVADPRGVIESAIRGAEEVFKGPIKKILTLGFAEGGFVPRGTDTVPAMLTPGEFVLNRAAAQQLGEANLSLLNRGIIPSQQTGSGGMSQHNEINLTINTTNSVDPAMVKSRVMPVILEELRRASLDGRRVLAPNGVR